MHVDPTPYEQYLPTEDQYDNKLPMVIDQLDDLLDQNVSQDGQPFSLDFEANEEFIQTFLIGRMLANRSIHAKRVLTADRELINSYYTGLMFSLQAVRLIQNGPVKRVNLRSVTRAEFGVEGSLQDYESNRPNISEYARNSAEIIAEKQDMTVAVGDAAILGFLLHERADGKNHLMHDIDAVLDKN